MKILLIYPADKHTIRTNVPAFVDEKIGVYPPLGLMYIAASIMRWSDWQVELLDCNAQGVDYQDLREEIKKRKPDVVGIQAITFTLIDVLMTAKAVKDINAQTPVVVGGPHVNIYANETLSFPQIDFIILGEAEHRICDFLKALEGNKNLSEVQGLGYKENGRLFINPSGGFIENLDELPYPARKILKTGVYRSLISHESPITTLMSSRGCPFTCLYCDRPHLGKSFRARSAENVVGEMIECKKMGIRDIFFYDDTFTLDRNRVMDICDLIIKRQIDIGWDARSRADAVDEAMLNRMAEAGCRRLHLGVESGTPEIQKVLRKNLDLGTVASVFRAAKKAGLKTLAYFMIGSPTETARQIEETVSFMLRLKADYVHISVATAYPHTDMYYLGLKEGIFKTDHWKDFAQNPRQGFLPKLWTENLSEDELISSLNNAYKRFYLRPSYILKDLLGTRRMDELKDKISSGLKILFS